MATMNISLPEQMKQWVEQQAEGGRYSNSSDYVRDLIRRDQERAEKTPAMKKVVTESLASGISPHSMQEILEMARASARKDQAKSA